MINKKKQIILKTIIGLIILLLFNYNSFSRIIANRGDCTFDNGDEKGFSMNYYITEGAGYFLNSYSDMLLFLNKVEMSELNGIDYKELRTIIYKSIENMEKAKDAYYSLKQLAEGTPYNQSVINLLLTFDYDGFQNERGLNSDIFKDVEEFLGKGDVRGLFCQLLSDTDEILFKLYSIKVMVDADVFPELSKLWRVNHAYSETMLFGQFAAEVFYEVTGTTKNECN